MMKWVVVNSLGLSLLFALSAQAGTPGVILQNKVLVRETPSSKSEPLVSLKKGVRVQVNEMRGAWVQIKVQLPKKFTFNGWVPAQYVRFNKAALKAAPIPTPSPIPTPTPIIRFTPNPTPHPLFLQSMPPPMVQPTSPPARAVQKSTPSSTESAEREMENGWFKIDGSYQIYQYQLNSNGTTPAQVFSYDLVGFGFGLDGGYWFWNAPELSLRAGVEFGYTYSLFQFNTLSVTVAGGTPVQVKPKNSSHDIILRVPFEYMLGKSSVGLNAGFEYYSFIGDDTAGGAAAPNLVVSQTTMSILLGMSGLITIPGAENWSVRLGADLYPLNFVSESPSNATGTDPKGELGFAPLLNIGWAPWEHHQFNVGYQLRMQKFTFSGTGSRVGTSNVTDGDVNWKKHSITFGYEYQF